MKLTKTFAWFAFGSTLVVLVFLILLTQGNFQISVNGEAATGGKRLFAGTIGLLVAGVALLFAMGMTAITATGAGLILCIILALVGLILIAIALPFLLPLLIPILALAWILWPNRKNIAKTT